MAWFSEMANGGAAIPALNRVGEYLWRWAEATPDVEAIVLDGRRFTYAQLAQAVRGCAAALIAAGCQPGDRVAMLATPGPEFMISLLATTEIGAIWVGLNPRYRMREFQHVIGQTAPKVLLAMTEIEGRHYQQDLMALTAEFDSIETLAALNGELPQGDDRAMGYPAFLERGAGRAPEIAARQAAIDRDDTAVIIFTSGSTGAPKGAMIRHRGLITGALTQHRRWPPGSRVRLLHNMPINHIAGVGMIGVYPIVTGGSLIFMDRFDARHMLALIERERVTFWLQAPTMFHLALTHPDFARFDLSSVEYIIWAGSPAPRDLIARLYQLDGKLATAFGMTELSLYVTFSDLDASLDTLSWTIGKPEPAFDLRVADADDRPVAPGEQGEIQARGDWMMAGYFNAPQATAEAFTRDGWFKTGDIAELHADGNLRIVGRVKEMYISGSYNIFPREIELVIESHPAAAAAAVIGVADEVFGEVGRAFVQAAPGTTLSAAELDAWCRERLANYKVPKRFEVMEELPRLPIGKIDKQSLKAKAAD